MPLIVCLLAVQAISDLHETRSHRDFKPANAMVSGWDEDDALCLVLIDFASSFLHEGAVLLHCLIVQYLGY